MNNKFSKNEEYDLNISFFEWLFESNNIKLHYEEDPVPIVQKNLIYCPQKMKNFFETQVLQDTLKHNYFGFKLLDEGNYDIDRFDYLYRDLAFNGKPQYKKKNILNLMKK